MERLIKAKVEAGRVAILWLGQSGFALKGPGGAVILVDPYLSDSANGDGQSPRLVDVPVRPKDVKLDYLFITHDHVDHLDPQSAPVIAQGNPDAVIVCPPSACRHLVKLGVPAGQITAAMPGQTLEFPEFAVQVTAAQHTEDSVGYVFEFSQAGDSSAETISVYVTGDTEYNDSLAPAVADYAPDVLLVPINGRWGNMDAAAAAALTAQIAPREVIPTHYGLFAANTADPTEFLSFLAAAQSDSQITPVVMKHGGCHIYCAEDAVQGKHAKAVARASRARAARSSHQHQDGQRGPGGPRGH